MSNVSRDVQQVAVSRPNAKWTDGRSNLKNSLRSGVDFGLSEVPGFKKGTIWRSPHRVFRYSRTAARFSQVFRQLARQLGREIVSLVAFAESTGVKIGAPRRNVRLGEGNPVHRLDLESDFSASISVAVRRQTVGRSSG